MHRRLGKRAAAAATRLRRDAAGRAAAAAWISGCTQQLQLLLHLSGRQLSVDAAVHGHCCNLLPPALCFACVRFY